MLNTAANQLGSKIDRMRFQELRIYCVEDILDFEGILCLISRIYEDILCLISSKQIACLYWVFNNASMCA